MGVKLDVRRVEGKEEGSVTPPHNLLLQAFKMASTQHSIKTIT